MKRAVLFPVLLLCIGGGSTEEWRRIDLRGVPEARQEAAVADAGALDVSGIR